MSIQLDRAYFSEIRPIFVLMNTSAPPYIKSSDATEIRFVNIFTRLSRDEWKLIFSFWLVTIIFVYAYHFYESTTLWKAVLDITYSIVIDTFFTVFFVQYVFPKLLQAERFKLLVAAGIGILITTGILYSLFESTLYQRQDLLSNLAYYIENIVVQAQSLGPFTAFLLGYRYFVTERKMLAAQKAQKESELQQLRAQVDPHFLFNNLNILDVLIETKPTQARLFLKKLASLYRYFLRHKDAEVVELREEITFAQDYIFLIESRFGDAYKFTQSIDNQLIEDYFIPPGALQTLLENAVKHNQGSDERPIYITLTLDHHFLSIKNTFRPKLQAAEGTGTGLSNLKARYQLLTEQPIKIIHNDNFEVQIPLLKMVEA